MTKTIDTPDWSDMKIDRKELADLLATAGISISNYPPDLFPPKIPYNKELFRLAELLVELGFYNLNEQPRKQCNKESGDLLPGIDQRTS